jgi:predicted permease
MLGRSFLPEEEQRGGERVVVLSHSLWRNRFAGDSNIIGKTIVLDNFGRHSYQIVGIMPPGFNYPGASVWIASGCMHQNYAYRGSKSIHVIGRLKPGVTMEGAQAELSAIQKRIAEANPRLTRMGTEVKLLSFHEALTGNARSSLWILFGAVVLVLLIACANVANLLLARALARRKEMAIRAAVGAGRSRIVRQLLIESLALALTGGACGILLALWGTQLVIHFNAGSIPRVQEIGIDWPVLGFAVLLSMLTDLLFGLAPAWLSSRVDLNEALKGAGQQVGSSFARKRLFNSFTVAEVALALILLVGAGLLIQSFVRLQRVETGFDTVNILTVDVDMAGASYKNDTERRLFFRQLLERVRALPGVEAACGVSMIPDRGGGWTTPFWRTDRPTPSIEERGTVGIRPVTPGFLAAFAIPLLKGREFTESDGAGSTRVIMINQAFADLVFPNEDPIGKHINCEGVQEIIGVVANVKNSGLAGDTRPEVYGSYQQWWWPSAFLVVRTTCAPRSLAAVITSEARALNPDQPLMYFKTMEQFMSDATARPRFRSLLLLAREMPVSKAGEILGETDQRLWRMLFAHIKAAYAQLSMEQVVWVGADEMNRKKGHNYLTVFVDLLAKRVLFATEGKDAKTWEAFATALLEHNGHPKAVTQVAIDMSPAYRKGVAENFGNANVSFDKFHVVGQVVESVDEVRRAERSEPDRGELLEKARWLFLKNPENWTDKEGARWEELAAENLATGLAYQMRYTIQLRAEVGRVRS